MNGHARNGHAGELVASALAADRLPEMDEADEADEADWLAMPAAGVPARPPVVSRPRDHRD
ncbi:MAG TPA: hypothetical protein VFY89_04045, partial [Ktedonobacterales bacterium]